MGLTGRRSALRVLLLAVALAAVALVRGLWPSLPGVTPEGKPAASSGQPPSESAEGQQSVAEAYRERRSDVWGEVSGVVQRVLPDDREGSHHERFILQLDDGHTLLVTHNVDVGERAPVASGDSVELRGEYEWNPQGGVVHWTHHDPEGRLPGGWIRTGGRTYR
jgi:hypothetical protein